MTIKLVALALVFGLLALTVGRLLHDSRYSTCYCNNGFDHVVYLPICGTDNNTYYGWCEYNCAKTQKWAMQGKSLLIAKYGLCDGKVDLKRPFDDPAQDEYWSIS